MRRLMMVGEYAVKKAVVQRSFTREGPSSAVPEVKNKYVLSQIVLDDTKGTVADNSTALLGSALQKHRQISQSPFRNLLHHLKHCGNDL